jgi:hypothetical protein
MKYAHIGWARDESKNEDKVWGIIMLEDNRMSIYDAGYTYKDNKYVSFWGRRGKKLQTKLFEDSEWGATQMFLKKQDKGYQSIDINELNTVYPEFEKDLQKTAVWAMLRS